MLSQRKMCSLYLVHGLGISLSKGIWHVTSVGSEFEVAGMLTVLPVTQDLCCFFGFFHIKRTNWHPACPLDPFHVSLVHSLQVTVVCKTGATLSFILAVFVKPVRNSAHSHHSAGRKPFWPGRHRWSLAGKSSCADEFCS